MRDLSAGGAGTLARWLRCVGRARLAGSLLVPLFLATPQASAVAIEPVLVDCKVVSPRFASYPDLKPRFCAGLVQRLREDPVLGLWNYVTDAREPAVSLTFSVIAATASDETLIELKFKSMEEEPEPWRDTWLGAGVPKPPRDQAASRLADAFAARLGTPASTPGVSGRPWRRKLLQYLKHIPVAKAHWLNQPSGDEPLLVLSSVPWNSHHKNTRFRIGCPQKDSKPIYLISEGLRSGDYKEAGRGAAYPALVVVVEFRLDLDGKMKPVDDEKVLRKVIHLNPAELLFEDESTSSVPTQ